MQQNTPETSGVKTTKLFAPFQLTTHAAPQSLLTLPETTAAKSPKTLQYTPQFPPAQTAHTAVAQTSSQPDSSTIPAFALRTNLDKFHPAQSPMTANVTMTLCVPPPGYFSMYRRSKRMLMRLFLRVLSAVIILGCWMG